MTQDKDVKIRETYLIKPGNRSDEVKEKFSKWIDSQSNAQSSIISLILHTIDRFGYADVMDHEVSRKMYMERLYFEGDAEAIKKFEQEYVVPHAATSSASELVEPVFEDGAQPNHEINPKNVREEDGTVENIITPTFKAKDKPKNPKLDGVDPTKF